MRYSQSPSDSEERMQALLIEFRLIIEHHDPALHASLRQGLPRDVVVDQLSRLPFAVSDEAIQLYCWADGVEDQSVFLIPYSYFVSLENAILSFEHLLPHQEQYEQIFSQKYRQSFPFLSDGSDGGYGLGTIDESCSGKVIRYNIHDEWTIGFESPHDMIKTLMEAYKQGLVDEDGEWDTIRFSDLVEDMNPGAKQSNRTPEVKFEITPPPGWYQSSDGASLSKGATSAFLTQIDSEARERSVLQRSRPIVNTGTGRNFECLKTKVQFGESSGWKFVSSQIEVSEAIQIDYYLEVPGGNVTICVISDVTIFDDAEFESALHTLTLKSDSHDDG